MQLSLPGLLKVNLQRIPEHLCRHQGTRRKLRADGNEMCAGTHTCTAGWRRNCLRCSLVATVPSEAKACLPILADLTLSDVMHPNNNSLALEEGEVRSTGTAEAHSMVY
jgi:hypothetical protein